MAGGNRTVEASPSHPQRSGKIAWISTRRAIGAADTVAANVTGRYLLSDISSGREAPLQELSTSHLVAFEIPPVVGPHFEHKLLDIVMKIRSFGSEVLIVVQPSLRRKSNKTLWVHKWNYLAMAPLQVSSNLLLQDREQSGGMSSHMLSGK